MLVWDSTSSHTDGFQAIELRTPLMPMLMPGKTPQPVALTNALWFSGSYS